MKKILITGATGFLGKVLLRKLSEKYEVYRFPFYLYVRNFREKNFKLFDKRYDTVIHLGARTAYTWLPWFQSFRKLYESNVKGTEELLKNVKTKQFIYISTLAVYSDHNLSKIKPRSFYGLTKYLGELKLKKYAKKMDVLIIRLPMVYDLREPKKETYWLVKFSFFLRFLSPILKMKKIRVISREEAIKKLIKIIELNKKGTIDVKGYLVDLATFLNIINS
ncbi:MAG: NAD(P)-dependent oxidoreductase [Candidatus Aenigmatarchaeota archaeon]